MSIRQKIILNRSSLFIGACAAIVACISGAVILGWLVHSATLVQVLPSYSSMKFNTAISLLFAAIAVIALENGHRRLAAALAMLGLLLPSSTLIEYLLQINLGIDNLFITPFIEAKVRYVGRMAPNTAGALFFIHLALVTYAIALPVQRACEIFLVLLASATVALGVVPLIGYLGSIETAHTWGDFAGMAVHTSICVVLLGFSIIASLWRASPRLPFWLGVPVGIFFVVIAISIWLAVKSYEDIRFEESLQLETTYIAARTGDQLNAFYNAIERIGSRWTIAGGTPRPLWEDDAKNYLKAYPFLQTLEWVDRDRHLQWAVPVEGSEKLMGIELNTEGTRADTWQQAAAAQAPQVTKTVTLLQGNPGFLYMDPVYVNDQFDGMIVAAFNVNVIFGRLLARDNNGPFYVTVTEDGQNIFSNTPDDYIPPERWQKSAVMQNKANTWTINVSPTPEMMGKKNSPLQFLILVIGLLTSIFATFSVLMAIRAQQTMEKLRHSDDKLRKIIDTHNMLTVANFDARIFMNGVVQRMLEVTPATGAVIELIENDEMVYEAASGTVTPYWGLRLKRAGSLSGLCVEKRETMISNDTSIDPRVDAAACKKVGANSMVIVPLLQRGEVVGVLKALSTDIYAFSDDDLNTLKLMAGLLGGALGQQLEIDRRQKLEDQLRHMAQNDSLTGLPNRMLFNDRLSHAIENNTRNGNNLAVMYMDIDHFKGINDVYGHAVGDELLKAFADRITKSLRKGDTLARMGGDEFTLIAENLKAAADAEMIAMKIVEAAREPFTLSTMTLNISVSVGVAIVSKNEQNAVSILEKADEALYVTKKAGRNGFKIAAAHSEGGS